MDTNSDGRISRSEAASNRSLTRGFSSADSDGDGYISNTEYQSRSGSDSGSMNPQSSPDSGTTPPRQ
jgi:hypothetical protein